MVLRLFLNRDGSLSGLPAVEETPAGRYNRTAPESAMRAVRRCAPYILPPDKYVAWQELRVRFDPIDMGGF